MRLTPYECHWDTFPPCYAVRAPPRELKWYPTPAATPPKGPVECEHHGTTRAAAPSDVTEADGDWTMVDL